MAGVGRGPAPLSGVWAPVGLREAWAGDGLLGFFLVSGPLRAGPRLWPLEEARRVRLPLKLWVTIGQGRLSFNCVSSGSGTLRGLGAAHLTGGAPAPGCPPEQAPR